MAHQLACSAERCFLAAWGSGGFWLFAIRRKALWRALSNSCCTSMMATQGHIPDGGILHAFLSVSSAAEVPHAFLMVMRPSGVRV